MEILKKGDLNLLKEIIVFTCPKCGCVFKAEKGEWGYTPSLAQQRGEGTYICDCPTCHYTIWK